MKYSKLYSWRYPVDDHVVGYHDGHISIAILWDGYHLETLDEAQKYQRMAGFYNLVATLKAGMIVENHLFRQYDFELMEKYNAHTEKAVRSESFGRFMRNEIANHIGREGLTNIPAFVVTIPVKVPKASLINPKLEFQAYEKAAVELKKELYSALRTLPGARFASVDEYWNLLVRSFYRDKFRAGHNLNFDGRFHINDAIAATKPEWEAPYLKVGNTYTWVGLIDTYPDIVRPGWVENIFSGNDAEYHAVQILKGTETHQKVMKAESEFNRDAYELQNKGSDEAKKKLQSNADFRKYITDQNISIIENCWLIMIHHVDRDELDQSVNNLRLWLEEQQGNFQSNEALSYHFWKVGQPGQGYKTKFLRDDAHDMVVNMSPVSTFDSGGQASSIRLTDKRQLVGVGPVPNMPNHGFKAAKVRSGKSLNLGAELFEQYPLGMDFAITEVGKSFYWPVEALGGKYFELDPVIMAINPFPAFDEILPERLETMEPLDTIQVSSVQNSLAFVLTGGKHYYSDVPEIGSSVETRVDEAIQLMYSVAIGQGHSGDKAPTFLDFFDVVEHLESDSEDPRIKKSFSFLKNNLEDFLSKTMAKKFRDGEDNLSLSGPLIGMDLKPLTKSNDKFLSTFYLTCAYMRLRQKAFANRNPIMMVFDEMTEFSRIDPIQTSILLNQFARLGPKENTSVSIISQAFKELSIQEGFLAQMTHKEYLYMEGEHSDVRDVFDMSDRALSSWQSFPDPQNLNYRESLRYIEKDRYFRLHLTWPQSLIDMCDSRGDSLNLKDEIGLITKDPFERLRLFRERKDALDK